MRIPDRQVGHYRVLETIGSGGMGVVFLAEDLNLGRQVALKFLPENLVSDETARLRLQQEARAASSLNHPNICTIYGIEHHEHEFFIVMELLHGQTLDAAIAGKGLSLKTLLKLASQIASALGAAHHRGIVHRDLKPANIFVTASGDAKVMDFGLAKRAGAYTGSGDAETLASPVTTVGAVVGTAMYMSPEQLRGAELDTRSDLFSFGIVLYEMATGRHPFGPGTPAHVIDGIFNRTPMPPAEANAKIPMRIGEIIGRLLEKDPALRYQHALDVEADLQRAIRDLSSSSSAIALPPSPRRRWRPLVTAAAALALAAGAFAAWQYRAADDPRPPSLANATFTQLTDQPGAELFPTLSPDGKQVAYTLRTEEGDSIVVQRVGGQKPIHLAIGSQPKFSPDGEQIAYHVDGGGIFLMGSTGESARRLTTFGFTPTWSPDGREIVFDTEGSATVNLRSSNSRLWRVAVEQGEPQPITPEGRDAVQPHWSPHGHRIAYWTKEAASKSSVWTIPAAGGEPVKVTVTAAQNWSPTWSANGEYLYFLSDAGGTMSLWWVAIDEASGATKGAAAVLTASSNPMASLSVSGDGRTMAYTQQLRMGSLHSIALDPITFAPVGKPSVITRLSKGSFGLDLTRDGSLFTYASASQDLYVMGADGSNHRQLTDGSFKVRLPHLSPDGKQIAFSADRGGQPGIWTIATDGSGLQQRVSGGKGVLAAPVWSPDGRLAYAQLGTGVFVHPPGADASARQLLFAAKPGELVLPWSWSPDGRRLGLTRLNRDNTIAGLIVYSFDTREVRTVSETDGAPLWLRDSRHVIAGEQWSGRVYVVDTLTGAKKLVFATALNRIDAGAVSADNRSLYLVLTALESDVWLLTMP